MGPKWGCSAHKYSPGFPYSTSRKNVFIVTQFSSLFTLFLGTIFIPSAKGMGVEVCTEVDSQMLADP